jgi:hypothetical protein
MDLETTASGRFAVRRQLGSGGMGVVYEAFDRQARTVIALKTLRDLEPITLLRFKNEFRALADLQHENLVRLGELFADDGRWFFTMELVRGQDFLSWVRGVAPSRLPTPPPEGSLRTMDARVAGPSPTADVPVIGSRAEVRLDRLRPALVQLARGLAWCCSTSAWSSTPARTASTPGRTSSGPSRTCRPSRRPRGPWARRRTSTPSVRCSTRRSPAARPSSARRSPC